MKKKLKLKDVITRAQLQQMFYNKVDECLALETENVKLKHEIGSFLNIITPEQMKEFDRIN